MHSTQAKGHRPEDPPPVPDRSVRLLSERPPCRGGPADEGLDGCSAPAADADAVDAHTVDADVARAVERQLDTLLAERVARAGDLDPGFARELAEPVSRFTRHGGKRIRPRFLWWTLRACDGGDGPRVTAALRIGAALELLQTCALVHDDVMDGARTRRGRPALHVEAAARGPADGTRPARDFGAAVAILAGDLALVWADDVVAETALPPAVAGTVRGLWRSLRTEMVAGQYLDLHGQAMSLCSPARALRAACLKSARYSVERPMALGAALAGADAATLRALCSAGRCVGTAFQLRDDLDDVFADPRRTGKPGGGDIRAGKPTYLVAVARTAAEAAGDRRALRVLDDCVGRADLGEEDLDRVREVLIATGARSTVETRIGRLTAHGLRRLAAVPLEPYAAGRLADLMRAVSGADPGGGPDPARCGDGAAPGSRRAGDGGVSGR